MNTVSKPSHVSTPEAAALLRKAPQTLRKAHCLLGEYCGIRPVKLPTGGLLWPVADIDRLLLGEATK